MSPAGIALRLQQHALLSQRHSSGQPRIQRTSLQLSRASHPRVQASVSPLQPTPVPQDVIAEACENVTTGKSAFTERITRRNPKRKTTSSTHQAQINRPVADINLPPGWSDLQPSTSELTFLEQHMLLLQEPPRRESQLKEIQHETSCVNSQPENNMSSTTKSPRKLPQVTSTTTVRSQMVTPVPRYQSNRSDATDSSLEPTISSTQIQRVSNWADEQRKTVRATIPTPLNEIVTRADTTTRNDSHSSTIASTVSYVMVDSRETSPVTVFFPRETLKSNIPHKEPNVFCDALRWMEQNRPTFVVPLRTAKPKPSSKSRTSLRLMGSFATLVDEYILALADDMRQAGVKDINNFPPVKPQHAIRGAFTLQEPVLHIIALKFPDPDTTPWCIQNLCPSLLCEMNHNELASLEERMVLAIHVANSAIHFLTASRDSCKNSKMRGIKSRAGQLVGKAHHAMHALYAGIVAVRRRDVIDPLLSVKKQLMILQQPVSRTNTLVDE